MIRDRSKPPRGQQYAVARMSNPMPDAKLVIGSTRYDDFDAADARRKAIDWRLSPAVILVDKVREVQR